MSPRKDKRAGGSLPLPLSLPPACPLEQAEKGEGVRGGRGRHEPPHSFKGGR